MTRQESLFYLREGLFNLGSAAFFAYRMVCFYLDYLQTARASSIIYMVFLGQLVFFSLIRKFPKTVSTHPFEWFVAFLGTAMSGLLQPAGDQPVLGGEIMQALGLAITFAGLVSLNRSYAMVPANRGVKTSGMYRLVRHPLYLGYVISDLGLLISQLSAWNLLIVTSATVLFVFRIRYEEALLLQDSTYQEFTGRTRYRLIPFVW